MESLENRIAEPSASPDCGSIHVLATLRDCHREPLRDFISPPRARSHTLGRVRADRDVHAISGGDAPIARIMYLVTNKLTPLTTGLMNSTLHVILLMFFRWPMLAENRSGRAAVNISRTVEKLQYNRTTKAYIMYSGHCDQECHNKKKIELFFSLYWP